MIKLGLSLWDKAISLGAGIIAGVFNTGIWIDANTWDDTHIWKDL